MAYFTSNAAFLYSPLIREQYAIRNRGLTPTVQFNDLAFAAHAVVLSSLTLSQFFPAVWGFDKKGKRGAVARISRSVLGVLVGSFVGVGIVTFIVYVKDEQSPATGWAWIDVVSDYRTPVDSGF